MDTVELARLQFAGTTGMHWLFVILTMGLAPLVAVMHTRAGLARDPVRAAELGRMTRFWAQLYVINYVMGIASGLIIEFQFGLSWSGLSKFAGNVFGAPIALETLIAFFAESTFLGMWIFGWGRLRTGMHVALIWLVALTSYASAYFILVANGFMQHPVGYRVSDGRVFLTDFAAVLTNSNTILAVLHISLAALVTGGIFVAGISAAHLLRRTNERAFFGRSLRIGVVTAALAAYPAYVLGAMQYGVLGETQPMKLAALGPRAETEALSAALARQYGPGDYVPPDWIAHAQYTMLYAGYLVFAVAMVALLVVFRGRLRRRVAVAVPVVLAIAWPMGDFVGRLAYGEAGPNRWLIYGGCAAVLGTMLLAGDALDRFRPCAWALTVLIPLPFLASVGGWLLREGGRQPWLIYGELTVRDALSPVSHSTMVFSLVAFFGVLAALLVTNWVLLIRFARRGPAGTQLGEAPEPAAPRADETVLSRF